MRLDTEDRRRVGREKGHRPLVGRGSPFSPGSSAVKRRLCFLHGANANAYAYSKDPKYSSFRSDVLIWFSAGPRASCKNGTHSTRTMFGGWERATLRRKIILHSTLES